jgi:hypothetical protein
MWVLIGVLILAFALGWFVRDFRALWAPAILGSAVVVVHLTSEDPETHWIYGFILGAGFAVSVGIVVLWATSWRTLAAERKGAAKAGSILASAAFACNHR